MGILIIHQIIMDRLQNFNIMFEELKENGFFVGIIDGNECNDLKSFLKNIGIAFHFPDYYGQNLNAFYECINDLDWIDENKYALVIENSKSFLSNEPANVRSEIIKSLYDVSQEWANVPNFAGEEKYRKKSEFKIIQI
jgi:RNAse (barnase) inhibitor barstar